ASAALLALAGCGSSKPKAAATPTPAPATSTAVATTPPASPSVTPTTPAAASSSPAVVLQNFCGLAPAASLSGVFTKYGTATASFMSPTCTFTSPSHNSTLAVTILTGTEASAAFASPD